MSTSGQGTAAFLAWVMLALCLRIGVTSPQWRSPTARRYRDVVWSAFGLWAVVAVPSLLQFAAPRLLHALRRDPDAIGSGQVWRLLTSVVVQDGGVGGTVFNLVILALVAVVAGRVWGVARSVAFFVVGVIVFNLITTFAFASTGAGNSAATYTLACSLAGLALVARSSRDQVITGLLVLATGVAMLALRDAHGFAVLLGVALGGAAARWWPLRGDCAHAP